MYHIVLNPAAGGRRSLTLLPVIEALFKRDGKPFTTLTTEAAAHATRLAKAACAEDSEGIIAIGGDGTVQEIVAGMFEAGVFSGGKTVPLGILPCGSGNDFNLMLEGKRPKKQTPERRAAAFYDNIINDKTRAVDVITAGGTAFLNAANIGLDARIVHNAAGLKKFFKSKAYLASSFKSILQHENVPMRVEVNGEVYERPVTLLAVCNGQYYGGGMRIAPGAQIDDGKITVCLVDGMSRPVTLMLFPTVLAERHVKLKAVRFIECESLTVTLSKTELLCADGNLFDKTGVIKFDILPGALKLFA